MSVTTVYTPDSPLRNLPLFFRQMARDLMVSRELGWRLFVRDASAQYRQSLLGYFWAFVPPILACAPFVYLRSQGIVAIGDIPVPYAAYAVIGTVIWSSFVDAVTMPLKTVSAARPMLTRINLPKEAILVSAMLQVLFSLLIRAVLLIAVFLWFQIVPAATAPLALLGVFALILFGFMVGLLLTPLGLLYNDVVQGLPVATTFLMLLTPVLYPAPKAGLAAAAAAWNPLAPLVGATRDWLLVGPSVHAGPTLLISAVSLGLLLFGWIAFRVAMPHLVARIGS